MNDISSYTLIEVEVEASTVLDVTLRYSDPVNNYTIRVEDGTMYDITYLDRDTLSKIVGRVVGLSRIVTREPVTYTVPNVEYIIKIDASSACSSIVKTIKSSQIRSIKAFIKYADEDTTIANSEHRNGTTVGTLTNVTIIDAVIDDNGNITDGKVTTGVINGNTDGGISTGTNPNGNTIVTEGGTTAGGTVNSGTIVNGITDVNTVVVVDNITTIPSISNVVIIDSNVVGGRTTDGVVVNPILQNSIVDGGIRSGSDMVTVGAIVVGDIATGGVTTGGILQGGTAIGTIDGKTYSITDGKTIGGVTSGGIVTGGVVEGGTVVGNVIVGAIIKGGTESGGTTVGGKTDGGKFTIGTGNVSLPTDIVDPNDAMNNSPNSSEDGLIIETNSSDGVTSNIGTTNI